jgi:flagellar biosynthesis regulator FlbT
MYIQPEKHDECMKLFLTLTEQLVAAAPSLSPALEEISPLVIAGDYYKALQKMKRLLQEEKNLLEIATAAT